MTDAAVKMKFIQRMPDGDVEIAVCEYCNGCNDQNEWGDTCDYCGGVGFRRPCDIGECREHGCSGYGACKVSPSYQIIAEPAE